MYASWWEGVNERKGGKRKGERQRGWAECAAHHKTWFYLKLQALRICCRADVLNKIRKSVQIETSIFIVITQY